LKAFFKRESQSPPQPGGAGVGEDARQGKTNQPAEQMVELLAKSDGESGD